MIHSKFFRPRVFPWNSARVPEQIDRAQDIGGDLTLNRVPVYEVGRDGILGYRNQTPAFKYSMTQFEYGSMAFWYALAEKEDPTSGEDVYIDLDDLTTSKSDIAAFVTDDNNTFRGTVLFPKLRVNGFSINIAAPDAIVERTFDLVGEDYKMFENKYFAYAEDTCDTADTIKTITLVEPAIEYATDKWIFRVLRVRAGEVTELVEDASSTYDDNSWRYATGDVIVQTCLPGDIIKIYYVSDNAYTTIWTNNNPTGADDPTMLLAEYCEIRMKVGTDTRIYRLQSVGIDVAFDRTDYKEIGNAEVVQTGVNKKTVTISLNRFAETMTLEQILAGDGTDIYIDPRTFSEIIQMQVLIYGEKEHTNFKMGVLINSITPSTLGVKQAVQAYGERNVALVSDNMRISSDLSELAFA